MSICPGTASHWLAGGVGVGLAVPVGVGLAVTVGVAVGVGLAFRSELPSVNRPDHVSVMDSV